MRAAALCGRRGLVAGEAVQLVRSDRAISVTHDDTSIITGCNATLAELEGIFGKKGETKGELRDLVRKENPSEVIAYVWPDARGGRRQGRAALAGRR